ncbi:hypothetical protein POM88_006897 [Heracleum sosnowskyi]|uniref:Helitron helicase-like domain-containing protein n=1 Tax=Heracleum sosnowskyi TaxID=360622 RepID=A0AAD8J535_9APIA|nr:hypothetical protein POM88_006897 [Heracleum sosnowskyi]
MIRPGEGNTLHLGGRLWQQFVVDVFAAVEQYRLDWIRGHRHIIRSELYKSIRDSIQKGDTNPDNIVCTVYHATDAYQSVIDTSSKSETTISGFSASGFGDNNLIEVSDTGTTPGNLKRKIASSSSAVLESVRKNSQCVCFFVH